ncbi:hypothetical protein Q4595_06595 [Wenyingzhuangia sp. 1_MG-2023]|nr:hypothetical protein [Wenyingzhuangia sp. 1_MG-2023]
MKFLKNLFQFYIYSNVHVSLSVACFVLVTGHLFDYLLYNEALFLSCATFFAYHFIRYLNKEKYGKKHLLDTFSNQYKGVIFGMVVMATIVCVVEVFSFKIAQVLRLLPFGILTLMYAFSFLKLNGIRYSIRYIPGLKIVVIALVWAGVIVFFPLEFRTDTLLYFLEMMLFVIVLTLPFDIRDMVFDIQKIKTFPLMMGLPKVRVLGGFFLLISIAIHYQIFNTVGLWQYVVTSSCLMVLLLFSSEHQSRYFASFWVEGIPILYYLLISFFS